MAAMSLWGLWFANPSRKVFAGVKSVPFGGLYGSERERLDKMAAAEDAETIAGSLRTLCREKCSEMDLKNHRTAYNALKKIGEPHRSSLQHMGYSARLATM